MKSYLKNRLIIAKSLILKSTFVYNYKFNHLYSINLLYLKHQLNHTFNCTDYGSC